MTSPVVVESPNTTLTNLYLGKAGNMQKLLNVPAAGYDQVLGRAEVAHSLASGGTTTSRRRLAKMGYTYSWGGMTPEMADQLTAFYVGAMGLGPYRLVDPSKRNHLPAEDANMGATIQANSGWTLPVGDTAAFYDSSIAPPTGIVGSGVMHWPTPVSGHTLYEGTYSGTTIFIPNANAPVYLVDQIACMSIYLKTATGSGTFTLRIIGNTIAGGTTPPTASGGCAVTTSWQRFSFLIPLTPAGFSVTTSPVWSLGIVAPAAAPDLHIAAAQLEYGVGSSNTWNQGAGVPTVTIAAPLAQNVVAFPRIAHTLTLLET